MENELKISLPKLGESIVSATVVQWFKKEGDVVALDESLLEVSTDKINSEIPSPVAGVLSKILAPAGTEVQVGETLAFVQGGQGIETSSTQQPSVTTIQSCTSSEMEDFLSPSVMRLLNEKKIPLSSIDKIPHTGQGGRLTKQDVEQYIASLSSACPGKTVDVERVKMSTMRKAIADNMVKSFYEAPHASLVTEVDVTPVMQLIQDNKQSFQGQYGAKLT
ncbi:MAG: 2-oxo acid dehydrogenase subunit E2, partial [Chlamydiales bacterium]|nr:2-oxo acid dehydrogenase subunit E2 [Chlamydiales bacterium]